MEGQGFLNVFSGLSLIALVFRLGGVEAAYKVMPHARCNTNPNSSML